MSAVAACVVIAAACGKKGNPLPPLRPAPAAIQDFSARRIDGRVELSFTIPAANMDGSTPVAIDRVEIFAVPVMTGVTPRPLLQTLADAANVRHTIAVRVPRPDDRPPAGADATPPPAPPSAVNGATTSKPIPVPGERVTVVDDPATIAANGATSLNYIAVGVVGGGRGRKGPASPVVTVSLAEPPAAPTGLTATHDEKSVTVTWARVTGQQVLLFDVSKPAAPASAGAAPPSPRQLTPAPVTTGTFSEPVVFGGERCFAARAVRVSGPATVVGPAGTVACVTPVDRYPPPAPASLQAIPEGAAVTLNWAEVDAPDLAGYIVLRGDGAGETMRPLVRQPIKDTTFSDTQVVPGATYTYSVYAVDNAPVPNVSQQSMRQSVTVR